MLVLNENYSIICKLLLNISSLSISTLFLINLYLFIKTLQQNYEFL